MHDLPRYRAKRGRTRLLAQLDALAGAVERRDLTAVTELLDALDASLPTDVRAEALMLVALPHDSMRAPVKLYRYFFVVQQLGDEPEDVMHVEEGSQMSLDLGAPGPADGVYPLVPRGGDPGPRRGGQRKSGSR